MQLRIVAVGKVRDKAVAGLCAEFQKRLSPYHKLQLVEVAASRGTDPLKAMREEGERVLRGANDGPLWLLDRDGTELSSESLSQKLVQFENEGQRGLTIAIAGTFGASSQLRGQAAFVWSLSKLTFLHEWARAIVLEQLYRAAKIARNEPYHH